MLHTVKTVPHFDREMKRLSKKYVSLKDEYEELIKVSVYARQELAMSNSGVGSVSYSGDAVINTMNSSGVVKIKKPS